MNTNQSNSKHLCSELVADYLFGCLEQTQAINFELHLQNCSHCRQIVAEHENHSRYLIPPPLPILQPITTDEHQRIIRYVFKQNQFHDADISAKIPLLQHKAPNIIHSVPQQSETTNSDALDPLFQRPDPAKHTDPPFALIRANHTDNYKVNSQSEARNGGATKRESGIGHYFLHLRRDIYSWLQQPSFATWAAIVATSAIMLLGIFAHISRYPHQRPDTVTKQRDIPAKSLEKQQKIERNAPQIQRPVYADVVIEREYYTVYLSYSLKHGMTVQSANEQEDIEIYSEGEYETFLAIDTTSPEQDEISSQVHQEPAHHQTAPDQTYISAVLPDAISLQPNEYSDPAIIVQLDSQPPSAVTPILLSGNQTTNIEL